ncbi:MAG: chemotaxis protein CheW [Crocosphaera sp.]|nr:chemotaxis protein CheW [Crocosphaera sp.]
MTIYSPRRSRRLTSKKQEKRQQMITFLLGKEQFALPIDVIQKVITMGKVYGDPQGTGISLTNYQDQELIVIDVANRIFGITDICLHKDNNEVRFMLVIKNQNNEIFGLPIDSPPSIMRVPESVFMPLPEMYLTQNNIRCLSSTIIKINNKNAYFVLDINQLL